MSWPAWTIGVKPDDAHPLDRLLPDVAAATGERLGATDMGLGVISEAWTAVVDTLPDDTAETDFIAGCRVFLDVHAGTETGAEDAARRLVAAMDGTGWVLVADHGEFGNVSRRVHVA